MVHLQTWGSGAPYPSVPLPMGAGGGGREGGRREGGYRLIISVSWPSICQKQTVPSKKHRVPSSSFTNTWQ